MDRNIELQMDTQAFVGTFFNLFTVYIQFDLIQVCDIDYQHIPITI